VARARRARAEKTGEGRRDQLPCRAAAALRGRRVSARDAPCRKEATFFGICGPVKGVSHLLASTPPRPLSLPVSLPLPLIQCGCPCLLSRGAIARPHAHPGVECSCTRTMLRFRIVRVHAHACHKHQCARPSPDGVRQQCPRSGAALRCIPPAHTKANLRFVSKLAVLQRRRERTRQTVLCQPRPPQPPRPTAGRYPCPHHVHQVQVQHMELRPRETSRLSPRWQSPRPSLSVRACVGPFRSRCMPPARQRCHQHHVEARRGKYGGESEREREREGERASDGESCFIEQHFAVFVLCCACKACKFRGIGRNSDLGHGRMGGRTAVMTWQTWQACHSSHT